MNPKSELPVLTDTALPPSHPVTAWDEYGEPREFDIAAEQALTVYIDKREVVTLMTLGTHPELLVLGFLKNHGFVQHLSDIKAIQVVWDVNAAAVTTVNGVDGLEEKLGKRTVTTGCGQGTVFGRIMEDVERIKIAPLALQQSGIYSLLRNLSAHNDVYKRAGAVHGCALCEGDEIVFFTEDVGRHNAVDAICGHMWLNHIPGANKVFYTTGRLTSEMVIKVAQMGIPVLLSRSGVTQAGLALAQRIGITMIARAKGRHFLVYHGREHIAMDAVPARSRRPPPDVKRR